MGGLFRRMLRNTSWLLLARLVTGFAGLGYLSLATHSLGVEGFGTLILIQTYVEIVDGLTTFQSWQAVIRYGAICLEVEDVAGFQQLLKVTTLLDVLGSVVGVGVAVLLAPYLAPYVGWDAERVRLVQLCSGLIVFSVVATPTGLLRLFDRFDLIAFKTALISLLWLLGTAVVVWLKGPFRSYLLAWGVSYGAGHLYLIVAGWSAAQRRGLLRGDSDKPFSLLKPIQLGPIHRGLLKFCLIANFDASLPLAMRQASPLLVGSIATPAAAGLFRIAYELYTPYKDLAALLSESLYPELSRLSSVQNWQTFKAIALRTLGLGLVVGLGMTAIGITFGRVALRYAFGPEFVPAYGTYILLILAGTLTLASCALEPVLYAVGRPGLSFRVNLAAIFVIYLPCLLVFISAAGALGAGMATLCTTAFIVGAQSWFAFWQVRKREQAEKDTVL
ncbi:MAG: lipopolysaccharide biosynthesis protein [Cyanobacteria bacterium J06607_13]